MQYFRLFSIILTSLIMVGCQTINPGHEPLADNYKLREAYANCLGYVYGRGVHDYEAFMIKPDDQGYFCLSIDGSVYAPNLITKHCDETCSLFSYDGKVVWEGFEAAEKYNKFHKVVDAYPDLSIRYNYNGHKISSLSKRHQELFDVHLKIVESSSSYYNVLALSPDGESYGDDRFWFMSDWRMETKKKKARKIALAICNAMSSRDDCVIYAENEKVYK